MSLLDQSGVTGGGLDPYNVHALFVNMYNRWTERFGNYNSLVLEVNDDLQFITKILATVLQIKCLYCKVPSWFTL